jgi:hypothetical protein
LLSSSINRTKSREKKYLFGIIGVGLAKGEEEMSQKRFQIDNDAFSFGTHSGIFFSDGKRGVQVRD